MPELKATPIQNNRTMALAKLLRSGRDLGNKLQIPEGVPLLGGQGVGDMFLGKAPEEVENWAYGNYPFQIPEMSNIPTMKTGRAEGVFDALSMVPVGGGGAGQAGTLPFKLKHLKPSKGGMHIVDDWVGNGMYPYRDMENPRTVTTMERLTKRADKLRRDEELHRLVHDPEEVAKLSALKPGDTYSPGRLLSTSFDPDTLDEIREIFNGVYGDGRTLIPVTIDARAGTKIGGDLGRLEANYYDEFLVRPDATFERVDTGPYGEFRLRSLTESEANLAKRKAILEKLRSSPIPDEAPSKFFHASPNEFERFDPQRFGSFTGKQTYGPGIYSTERVDAARHHLFLDGQTDSGYLYELQLPPSVRRQMALIQGLRTDADYVNDPRIKGLMFENDPFEMGDPVWNSVVRNPDDVRILSRTPIKK